MKRKAPSSHKSAINIRGLQRDTFYRIKMAAAAEHKSVRELILALLEGKIQELERKGLLPKGKE